MPATRASLATVVVSAVAGQMKVRRQSAGDFVRARLDASTDLRDPVQLGAVLERLQDAIVNALEGLFTMPFIRGTVIETTDGTASGITFTAGQTITLSHRLGKSPRYWLPLEVVGGYGSFQRVPITDADEAARFIKIRSQNACTAIFWVGG